MPAKKKPASKSTVASVKQEVDTLSKILSENFSYLKESIENGQKNYTEIQSGIEQIRQQIHEDAKTIVVNGREQEMTIKEAIGRLWERTYVIDNYKHEDLKASLDGLVSFAKFINYLQKHKKVLVFLSLGFIVGTVILFNGIVAVIGVSPSELILKLF